MLHSISAHRCIAVWREWEMRITQSAFHYYQIHGVDCECALNWDTEMCIRWTQVAYATAFTLIHRPRWSAHQFYYWQQDKNKYIIYISSHNSSLKITFKTKFVGWKFDCWGWILLFTQGTKFRWFRSNAKSWLVVCWADQLENIWSILSPSQVMAISNF